MGIEPTTEAWEAAILPLNYIRKYFYFSIKLFLLQTYFAKYKNNLQNTILISRKKANQVVPKKLSKV